MTILIAPDKFKGSLTAQQVCKAIEAGLLSINPSLKIVSIPLADGGEGTSDLLTDFSRGSTVCVTVADPLFRKIESAYGISKDGRTAFIEMAKASGLQLLNSKERNPLNTTTFGTGQLIKHAMERGVNHIILGIGGSATNDAGIGMAEALGYSFFSATKDKLKPVGKNLVHLATIDTDHIHPLLLPTKFTVLCDVQNQLSGKGGAAFVFGPQKGASGEDVKILDRGLRKFKKIAEATFNKDVDFPGAGAAGGLGAGAKVFLDATLSRGFEFIANFTQLEALIRKSDLVLTGEGKIDHQTLSGKVVKGVAGLAAQHQKPCIAFTGKCDLPVKKIQELNLLEIISISNKETIEQDSITHAFSLLKERTITHLSDWIIQIDKSQQPKAKS